MTLQSGKCMITAGSSERHMHHWMTKIYIDEHAAVIYIRLTWCSVMHITM